MPELLPAGVALTAIAMAQERHLETLRSDGIVHDALAETLVEQAIAATAGTALSWLNDGLSLSEFCPAMGDFVALRTRYFDDRAQDVMRRTEVRQVVLPAAGLDSRAFRLPWPAGVRLFEIDQPDLIDFKPRTLSTVDARPRCHRTVVPADLQGNWADALVHNGFDPRRPTLWLVEGLLMYLTDAGDDRLLGAMTGLSAPGSWLIADHAYPAALRNTAFSRGYEALVSNDSPFGATINEPATWLADHAWSADIAGPTDIVAEHPRPLPTILDPAQPDAPIFWLATATRTP